MEADIKNGLHLPDPGNSVNQGRVPDINIPKIPGTRGAWFFYLVSLNGEPLVSFASFLQADIGS